MRVISGTAKGTTLLSVPGDTTRPILDRVKTTLFDILRPELPEMQILDLFAGSGSVGIEALSQGADHCIFLDLEKKAIETIHTNLERTKLTGSAEVRHTDAFKYLRHSGKSFDLIYVAPPQYQGIWVEALQAIATKPALLKDNGYVIAQIDKSEYEEVSLKTLSEVRKKTIGNTILTLYQKQNS